MLERIEADLVTAMKAGDSVTRETLRLLKSAVKNTEIEKGNQLSDEEVVAVIQREVKRRKEAVESYKAANRAEQAAAEEQEAAILTKYLPSQMSEAELQAYIENYLEQNPATSDQVGQVMGALSVQLRGKADMGLVSRLVREKLG